MAFDTADLILTKGKVITMDSRDSIAEAVAVRDGRIVYVGSSEEIARMAGEETHVIDLGGKTMIPGFGDAHAHLDMYGMMTSDLTADCRIPPLGSVDEILQSIRDRSACLAKGELVIGQARPFQEYPTKEQLDQAAPDHPVIVKASMHWYLLNSRALEKFKITRGLPILEDLLAIDSCAFIQRNEATNEPTGYLEECWNYLFPRSVSPFTYEEAKRCIGESLQKASRYGLTSATELLCHPESTRIYQDLHNNGDLKVRLQLVPCFYGSYRTVELDEVIRCGLTTGFGNDWIKFGGLKTFLDSHQLKLSYTQARLDDWFGKAHRNGLRMFMHAITKDAQEMGLRSIEKEASSTGLESIRAMRHRMEHMGNEDLDPTFFQRVKNLGAIALPTAYFMNMGPGTLASPRTKKSFMFKTLLDMGLCAAGSSDTAGAVPEALNPMYEIWCMVNRKSLDGNLVSPSEKISVLEALRVYTIHSAYAAREEEIKGSIETGKLADFVVLDKDPFTIDEDELKDVAVAMTIVDGKIVYERNEP